MNYFKGIKLNFKGQKRDNYMSPSDLYQDLTTETLIHILPTLETLESQITLMTELESRIDEIGDEKYFELLETCNGI